MLISPDQENLSIEQLTALSEEGNVVAQFYLGMSYHLGLNTSVDNQQAVRWWTEAAQQGNREAQFLLGQCYYFGTAVEQDLAASATWYGKASDAGHTQAQFTLAGMLLSGTGVPSDPEAAVRQLSNAAAGGSADAATALGRLCEEGKGTMQDYQQAFGWFNKALELNEKNLDAAYSIGVLLQENRVPGRASIEAVGWYERAAQGGHALAQYTLGMAYLHGEIVLQDYAESRKWLEQAAAQRHGLAAFQLALLIGRGWGGPRDVGKLLESAILAAEQDVLEAQYMLGMMYWQGKDVEKDAERAAHWFRRLADKGSADGAFLLGNVYRDDLESPAKAADAYLKAAKCGHVPGQYCLAMLYHAAGPLQDKVAALRWYEACALASLDPELASNARLGIADLTATAV